MALHANVIDAAPPLGLRDLGAIESSMLIILQLGFARMTLR